MPEQSHQISGVGPILAALDAAREPVELILVRSDADSSAVQALLERAAALGVPVRRESANDLRRMSRTTPPTDALALTGRAPKVALPALLSGPGAVWLLAGVAYPSNAGFAIRCVEVAGAAGIVLDAPFSRSDRLRALRISMRANRFLPVLWRPAAEVVAAARTGGRPIVAVESSGDRAPWEVDLRDRPLLVVGGERDGIPADILASADSVVRIPAPGFIGSYNLQAAIAAVAVERLRQSQLALKLDERRGDR